MRLQDSGNASFCIAHAAMQGQKQLKTHSTAHTGKEIGPNHKEKQKNKNKKEDTVCGTFNTTQHSRCKNDNGPHTALKMLHKNGITLYIHNAG